MRTKEGQMDRIEQMCENHSVIPAINVHVKSNNLHGHKLVKPAKSIATAGKKITQNNNKYLYHWDVWSLDNSIDQTK
jgi:hypothetical protein